MGLFDEYNQSRTGGEADARAMFADWRTVGSDLHRVMQAHAPGREQAREQTLAG